MFTINNFHINKFFDFDIESSPKFETTPGITREGPITEMEKRAQYFQGLMDKGEATQGQQEWLKSYQNDPRAPERVHYFRMLQGNKEKLTNGQETYLKSYEINPRAPQEIHYIRQIMSEGQKPTQEQQKLLDTYEGSITQEPKPTMPQLD